MEAAAAFLAARPRSIAEVRRRLRQHGYAAGLVEIAVDRLGEMGYLDDEAFARAWVASRDRARPRGERALRQELIQKGIDRETIGLVLAERTDRLGDGPPGPGVGVQSLPDTPEGPPGADGSGARRLLERRRRSLDREPDPAKRRQKAYALLARNGFDPETCRVAASAFVTALSDPGDA